MNQRVLVTGGAGFLGSHLCERLLAADHHVICLDNFFTGNRRNISQLLGNPQFELIDQDVEDSIDLEVDRIFNLACPASPVHYQRHPVKTIRTNVHGSINLLDLAQRRGARILQASTSEVYGDPEVHPQTEGYWGRVNPIGPRACYDEGKRSAETQIFDYHREFGVDIKVVRIFNTYGPRMHPDDGRVVSNFIVHALQGRPLEIYGDGNQTRSFCYVDDLIEAMLRMMDTETGFTGPVNIGNPGEFTIRQLAELVLRMTGSASEIVSLPATQDDPRQRKPDISLAGERLDWRPSIQLEQGLERTIAYFRALVG